GGWLPCDALGCRGRKGRWLVDQCPENSELADRRDELIEVDRLYNISVGAQLISVHQIVLLARGRENDDGKHSRCPVGPDLPQRLETVNARHLQIEQDDGRWQVYPLAVCVSPMQEIQGLGSVAHHDNLIRQIEAPERGQGEFHI